MTNLDGFQFQQNFFISFFLFLKMTEALSGKDYNKMIFFGKKRLIVLIAQKP